jgi:arylsulfatase A-like enzyme
MVNGKSTFSTIHSLKNNKHFSKTVAVKTFIVVTFTLLISLQSFAQQRPNIIYIMSDDHDADAISAYNKRLIQTPGIDRIAKEGMRFNKYFVSNSICAPARATILTGKFSHMNGHKDNQSRFDTSQYTFSKQLMAAGYQTALIGKWHLQTLPSGFDYWTVVPDQGKYYSPQFITMNGQTTTYRNEYATSLITKKTIDWIEQRDKSKPFMLMMHHKAPHRNWWPELKFAQKFSKMKIPEPSSLYADTTGREKAYRDQQMRILEDMTLCADLKIDPEYLNNIPHLKPSTADVANYKNLITDLPDSLRDQFKKLYSQRGETLKRLKPKGKELLKLKYQWYMQDYLATVASIDESVAQLLNYLDKTGLTDNTVIIYTSDQGFYLGENGWFDKRFMYDVSMQSPLLVKWKGKIKAGTISNALTQNIDIAPTILDIAGEKAPAEIQGLSLKPILTGQKNQLARNALYYRYYEYPIDHHVYPHLGIRTENYKLIYFYTVNEWELYDLKKDPAEKLNRVNDPSYQSIYNSLKQNLIDLRKKYQDHEAAGELN